MNTIYEDKELARKLAEALKADQVKKEDITAPAVQAKPEQAPVEHQAL